MALMNNYTQLHVIMDITTDPRRNPDAGLSNLYVKQPNT